MKFRLARHTNNLDQIVNFYTSVLGFEVLGSFKNHDGFDGIFIGKPDVNWHLEFTTSREKITVSYNDEDYFVFYPSSIAEIQAIEKQITHFNLAIINSSNPYWNKNALLIKDPDGFSIAIFKTVFI